MGSYLFGEKVSMALSCRHLRSPTGRMPLNSISYPLEKALVFQGTRKVKFMPGGSTNAVSWALAIRTRGHSLMPYQLSIFRDKPNI